MEVREAIPYNAAMLNRLGVLTGINSDDAEMGRRLNQEAAKAIKYGGTTEIDALKMVTINPARMLHIDNKVGSIKAGKDADLVLWNGHPLSIYSRVEKTFIDGILYFDLERDKQMRQEIMDERNRIINKMLEEKQNQKPVKPLELQVEKIYHCDDHHDEGVLHDH
jgi:adenine deaminase